MQHCNLKLLPSSYYLNQDLLFLARDMLGKIIVSDIDGKTSICRIVETEAYRAPEDRGSHAFGNKVTGRTATMFAAGGRSYVYLCYGIHHLCNVVSAPSGIAHATLIRAVEPLEGIDIMLNRRHQPRLSPAMTNGPGKWTMAMGITTSVNGVLYHNNQSPIRIYTDQAAEKPEVVIGLRVGIAYASAWAHMPWRFRIADNPYTSLPHSVTY